MRLCYTLLWWSYLPKNKKKRRENTQQDVDKEKVTETTTTTTGGLYGIYNYIITILRCYAPASIYKRTCHNNNKKRDKPCSIFSCCAVKTIFSFLLQIPAFQVKTDVKIIIKNFESVSLIFFLASHLVKTAAAAAQGQNDINQRFETKKRKKELNEGEL